MSRKNLSLLLHPLFLINLFLLIANDHWWKYAYPNALTGKISDFAGVFVLAVFLVACFSIRKVIAVLVTALFFVWWKSPLSEPVITFFELVRVIDYPDLFALSVLPLVFYIRPYQYPAIKFPVRYFTVLIAGITLTAIVATTMPVREFWRYPPGRVSVNKHWRTQLTTDQFLHKLDSLQIPWKKGHFEYLPVYTQGLMLVEKNGTDSIDRMKPVDDLKDTMLLYQKDLGEHYLIPYLALEKDTITNVRFYFHEYRKKRYFTIIAMTIPEGMQYNYYMKRPIRKKYWAIFKSFMLE
jgi:hypothetical protein